MGRRNWWSGTRIWNGCRGGFRPPSWAGPGAEEKWRGKPGSTDPASGRNSVMAEFRRKGHRLPSASYEGRRAYFLTLCTQERKRLFTDASLVDAMIEVLKGACEEFALGVYAYCFMPDHLHVILVGDPRWGGRHCEGRLCCPDIQRQRSGKGASNRDLPALAERLLRSCDSLRRVAGSNRSVHLHESSEGGIRSRVHGLAVFGVVSARMEETTCGRRSVRSTVEEESR